MRKTMALLLVLALLLPCLPALAEGAAIQAGGVPASVRAYFESPAFAGYTVGPNATLLMPDTVCGSFFFAVAQKDGRNVLHMFKEKNGRFEHALRTDGAIPQGAGSFSLANSSGPWQLLNDQTLNFSDCVSLIYTLENDEEQGYAGLAFSAEKSGEWHVRLVFTGYLWDEALVTAKGITYYSEGRRLGAAVGTVQTDLRYFSFSAFPKTLAEGKDKLSSPPEIPLSAQLRAKEVKFTGGKKYAVYTGPGEKFLRAADGKAAVSTNDWVQVFGVEDGWAMIQYDLSSEQMRIGWIDARALPQNAGVDALHFNDQPVVTVDAVSLTDDPLKSRTPLTVLQKGQQVTWLATLGNWAYVQDDQSWVRGFVPLTAISEDAERTFTSQPVTGFGYRAQATVVLSPAKYAQISVSVTGDSAWLSAPPIRRYQVYANNTLIGTAEADLANSGPAAVAYRCALYLPQNASVIGLCPVYDGGVKAEEAITVFVGP